MLPTQVSVVLSVLALILSIILAVDAVHLFHLSKAGILGELPTPMTMS